MRYYRGMREAADGFPALDGNPATALNVRVPEDIAETEHGTVLPGRGGMSVTHPDPMRLPVHRRPPSLEGTAKHPVFYIEAEAVPATLTFRCCPINDDFTHYCVEPANECPVADFRENLAGTRQDWAKL